MYLCKVAAAKETESCPKHNFLRVMSGLKAEGLLKKYVVAFEKEGNICVNICGCITCISIGKIKQKLLAGVLVKK